MKTSIEFLQAAPDFKELEGLQKVYAYSTDWKKNKYWVDKGYGISHTEWVSIKDPILPTKITIETDESHMPGYTNTSEVLFFYGKTVFEQSDDYGRRDVIWLSDFYNDLNACDSEKELMLKIKQIKKKGYFIRRCNELRGFGLDESQITKFVKCDVHNKWRDVKNKAYLIKNNVYPKTLFKDLMSAKDDHEFDRIARNWGIESMFGFHYYSKKSMAKQIYLVK